MRDVILVEEFAVVERLEPELTEGFALRVGAHDPVQAYEAGQADSVETLGVEDGGRVADAFGNICFGNVSLTYSVEDEDEDEKVDKTYY